MNLSLPLISVIFLNLALSVAARAQSIDARPLGPALAASETKSPQEPAYKRLTGKERLKWFTCQAVQPQNFAAGIFSAAIGTARDTPNEYRGTWAGFGRRLASRDAAITLGSGMEAGFGAIWGEDPRYFRKPELPIRKRVTSVLRQAFFARRPDGQFHPAFARYIGTAGNNFISNTWRPDSEADTAHAVYRTALGFLDRLASNAFNEFWPDAKHHLFRGHH